MPPPLLAFRLIPSMHFLSAMTSTVSPTNNSSTMSLSASNTEPLHNEMFDSQPLKKLQRVAFLRGENKALQDFVASSTSAAELTQRRRDDNCQEEHRSKRRRSDEDTPKRRPYQRRNSQTAFMLFASVAAASVDDDSLRLATESVDDDTNKQRP